jgi:DNA-binding response OmpR family regulator
MAGGVKTILVVDDDRLVRNSLKLQFERKEFKVVTAEDGNAGLAQLDRAACDVVLLDILMPAKEGIETLIEIKRRFPETRVIAMTGGGSMGKFDFLAMARKFGADGVLKKPIDPQELFEVVGARRPE